MHFVSVTVNVHVTATSLPKLNLIRQDQQKTTSSFTFLGAFATLNLVQGQCNTSEMY